MFKTNDCLVNIVVRALLAHLSLYTIISQRMKLCNACVHNTHIHLRNEIGACSKNVAEFLRAKNLLNNNNRKIASKPKREEINSHIKIATSTIDELAMEWNYVVKKK